MVEINPDIFKHWIWSEEWIIFWLHRQVSLSEARLCQSMGDQLNYFISANLFNFLRLWDDDDWVHNGKKIVKISTMID